MRSEGWETLTLATPSASGKSLTVVPQFLPPVSSWLSSVPPQIPPVLLQILVLLNCKFSWAMGMGQKPLRCASVVERFSGLSGLVFPLGKAHVVNVTDLAPGEMSEKTRRVLV